MKRTALVFVIFSVLVIGLAHNAAAEVLYWKADEIRAGMKGYGYSVFNGHDREKFYFKVTGLQDTDQGVQFLISIWKEAGGKIKPFNIASGMSGSPLYINGKLAAAVASGWETATSEGTARPFQFMYEEAERAMRFRSMYRGIKRPFLESISSDRKLKPGSSIKIGYITGDQALSDYVMGTVTAIDEETGTVFALGHTMSTAFRKDAPSGPVSYTAWEGGVAGTVNDVGEKVPAWDAIKGEHARVWFNGVDGVYGTLDEIAEEIPFTIELESSGYRKKVEMGIPYGITTLGFAHVAVEHFLNTYVEPLGEITVDVNGFIGLESGQKIPVTERFSHSTADTETFSSIFLKKTYFFGSFSQLLLADNHIRFSGLRLIFRIQPLGPILTIRNVAVLKRVISSGGQLSIAVQISEKGNLETSARRYEPVITIPIPKDSISGDGRVIVETGETFVNRTQEAMLPPANLNGLVRNIIQNNRSNASFYVTILLPNKKDGAKINRIEKENLNDAWRKLGPGETLFTGHWDALAPICMAAPLPNAVIISDDDNGRYEINFQIEPVRRINFAPVINFGLWIFWIIVFFTFLQVSHFVAIKYHPQIDRAWIRVLKNIRRYWGL